MRASSRAFAAVILLTAACGGASAARPRPAKGGPAVAAAPPPGAIEAADGPAAGAVSADLSLTTSDGVDLATTYVAGPADAGCVVLAHQLGGSRAEWTPLIDALAGQAHILAIDLRGHGGSTHGAGGVALDWHDFDAAAWRNVDLDLDAARAFFASMGIGTDRCVYVGSSIGATAALRFAGKYFDLAGLALLSPGLTYRGIEVLPSAAQFGGHVLMVVSDEAGPRDAADVLARQWRDMTPPAEPTVVRATGAGHGLKMASDDPAVVPALAAFIATRLAARAGDGG